MHLRRIFASLLAVCCLPLSAAAQPVEGVPSTETVSRFQAAQEALQEGRFAAAESAFRALLEADPDIAEARANLGLALFLQGKYVAAVAELEGVAAAKPDLAVAHLFLGLGHLKLGAPAEAIPALERSLEGDPRNLDARRALAACYLAEGDYAGAVREYQAVHSLTPDKAEAWHVLGRNYMNLMSELGGRLVNSQPDSAWAARLGADMLGLSQAWEASAQYYESALAMDPAMPGLRASLGSARLRLGDQAAAAEDFRAELRIDPYSEPALLGLAEVRLARGDAAGALADVESVWASFPRWLAKRFEFPVQVFPRDTALELIGRLPRADGGPARFLQAALFAAGGEQERATLQRSMFLRELERAPTRSANDAEPRHLCREHLYVACAEGLVSRKSLSRADLLTLGRAYFALDDLDRAVVAFAHAMRGAEVDVPEAMYWTVRALRLMADRCFEQVERLDPTSWRVHQMRAEALQQRQLDDDAITEYRKAIDINPEEAALHRDLGLLYLLNNDYERAQQSLERALGLDGANPRSLYFLGRLHVAKQLHPESIRFFEAALRLDPNLVQARPSLGRAYLRVGRAEEAVAELTKGLALDYYGDIHYSLFQAYRRLGKLDEAKMALDRSTAMRKRSFVRDRGKLDRWIKGE